MSSEEIDVILALRKVKEAGYGVLELLIKQGKVVKVTEKYEHLIK